MVGQIALAMVLLAGSGLLIRSFSLLRRVDPGFDARSALTFRVSLPDSAYADDARRNSFHDALDGRLRALPGVRAVGAVSGLPLTGNTFVISFTVDGRPEPPPAQQPSLDVAIATAGYFRAMGIELVRGRGFTRGRRPEGPPGRAPERDRGSSSLRRRGPDRQAHPARPGRQQGSQGGRRGRGRGAGRQALRPREGEPARDLRALRPVPAAVDGGRAAQRRAAALARDGGRARRPRARRGAAGRARRDARRDRRALDLRAALLRAAAGRLRGQRRSSSRRSGSSA